MACASVPEAAVSFADGTIDAGGECGAAGAFARLMPRMLMLVGALIVGLCKVVHHSLLFLVYN